MGLAVAPALLLLVLVAVAEAVALPQAEVLPSLLVLSGRRRRCCCCLPQLMPMLLQLLQCSVLLRLRPLRALTELPMSQRPSESEFQSQPEQAWMWYHLVLVQMVANQPLLVLFRLVIALLMLMVSVVCRQLLH